METQSNPFASPQAQAKPDTNLLFESAYGWGILVCVFLAICLIGGFALSLLCGVLLSLLGKARAGTADPAEFDALQSAENLRAIVQLVGLICAAIAFIMWMHAAYRNAEVLGAPHLRYSRGWTIGAWFIPFLNLVRPYQVVREIALASDPNIVTESRDEREMHPTPGVIKLWWTFYLLMAVMGRMSGSTLDENPTLDQIQTGAYIDMVLGIFIGLAALCAILTIRKIDHDQQIRANNTTLTRVDEV